MEIKKVKEGCIFSQNKIFLPPPPSTVVKFFPFPRFSTSSPLYLRFFHSKSYLLSRVKVQKFNNYFIILEQYL